MTSRQKIWGFIALTTIPFLSLVILLCSLSRTEKQSVEPKPVVWEKSELHDAEQIVALFQEGLQISSDEALNDEARLFGSALMENALEQFGQCPRAVKGIWTAMSRQIENSELQLKVIQIELMLDYVDQALLRCCDRSVMQDVWAVRTDIAEKRREVEYILAQQARDFFDKVSEEITTLETDLNQERKKDSNTENADYYEPSEENSEDGTWKKGPYQIILTRALEIQQTLTSDLPSFLLKLPDDDEPSPFDLNDINDRVITLALETTRMQRIRYNLWCNRIVYQCRDREASTVLTILSKIDSGSLFPSVASLFSECEQKNMARIDDAHRRSIVIRASLLTPKVPLSAF